MLSWILGETKTYNKPVDETIYESEWRTKGHAWTQWTQKSSLIYSEQIEAFWTNQRKHLFFLAPISYKLSMFTAQKECLKDIQQRMLMILARIASSGFLQLHTSVYVALVITTIMLISTELCESYATPSWIGLLLESQFAVFTSFNGLHNFVHKSFLYCVVSLCLFVAQPDVQWLKKLRYTHFNLFVVYNKISNKVPFLFIPS